jgi:hypothetical protein
MNAIGNPNHGCAVAFRAVLLLLALASAGYAQRLPRPVIDGVRKPAEVGRSKKPADLTDSPDSELHQRLGERVIMHGKFSLRGKAGPFILVRERPIYIQPHGPISWKKSYAGMEGKDVQVTGILRFEKNPEAGSGSLPAGTLSDHFYFEAESAKIELRHQ